MTRGAAAVAAVFMGVALGGLAGRVLSCVVAARDLGPPVQVHPVIRAWDAGGRPRD